MLFLLNDKVHFAFAYLNDCIIHGVCTRFGYLSLLTEARLQKLCCNKHHVFFDCILRLKLSNLSSQRMFNYN